MQTNRKRNQISQVGVVTANCGYLLRASALTAAGNLSDFHHAVSADGSADGSADIVLDGHALEAAEAAPLSDDIWLSARRAIYLNRD